MARLRSMFGGGSNYAYVTARVRAMKTDLLPTDTYPKLLARDVHEIGRFLQEGRYRDDVDALAGRFSGARLIELATRRNMGRDYERVLSFCRGEARALLALYLQRYDIFDAKTVLRGVSSRARAEEIRENLLPGGTVPDTLFEQAMTAGGLDEAVDVLVTAPQLAAHARERGQPLAALEDALDRAYYADLLGAIQPSDRAKQAFLDFIKEEIDIVNLKAVLRLKHAGLSEYALVPGGRQVDEALVRRLMSAARTEVGAVLDATDYGARVKDATAVWAETGDLNPVVTAFDRLHVETSQRFSHLYPLSILPVVDYVLRKRIEADNLRIIAVGKASALDDETIRSLVMA